MVGRADQHDVEIFFLEHLAVIGNRVRGVFFDFCRCGNQFGRAVEHVLIDVAERDHFDRRHLDQPAQIALAVPAGADQADAIRFLLRRNRRRGH